MAYSPEVQAIMDRVMGREPAPVAKPDKSRYKTTPTVRKARPKPPRSLPSYDRAAIKAMHDEGKTVSQIVKVTGAHRSTISRALNAAGVAPEDRKGGPVRREMCPSGKHSMKDAPEVKGGGRRCPHCRREREAA